MSSLDIYSVKTIAEAIARAKRASTKADILVLLDEVAVTLDGRAKAEFDDKTQHFKEYMAESILSSLETERKHAEWWEANKANFEAQIAEFMKDYIPAPSYGWRSECDYD